MATSATSLLKRYGYPKVPGDQPWSVLIVTGPANYTPVTPGSPGPPVVSPSGGQLIRAQDFGLQSFDFVVGMASNDGLYFVAVIPLGGGGEFNSVLLNWVEANPVEDVPPATNLSTSTVRLLAIGR